MRAATSRLQAVRLFIGSDKVLVFQKYNSIARTIVHDHIHSSSQIQLTLIWTRISDDRADLTQQN